MSGSLTWAKLNEVPNAESFIHSALTTERTDSWPIGLGSSPIAVYSNGSILTRTFWSRSKRIETSIHVCLENSENPV